MRHEGERFAAQFVHDGGEGRGECDEVGGFSGLGSRISNKHSPMR